MYIQELQLQNFKGFDNIELEFHPELSILVGPNGAGKPLFLKGQRSQSVPCLLKWMAALDGASIKARRI